MNKRGLKLSLALFLGIFLIGIASATYCCERTTSGAYCQNVDSQSECAVGVSSITGEAYRSIPASCEATSYCKPGTCINQQEGTCMSNTAQIICEGNYGFWSPNAVSSLPQCKAGCCIMGTQAAFVTQVTCNRLAAQYGVTTTFQSGITNELQCLLSANAGDEGACVYTKDYATTCERSTREDCLAKEKTLNATFHNGFLCSAAELGSNCGKTQNTKCDESNNVRFVDSCGNLANIYDASKVNDEAYWTHITNPTCGNNAGNKNSATCGACDYYSGTMCGEKKTGETVSYGNNLCRDLDCVTYDGEYNGEGQYPRHGESWCATTGTADSVGSSYFRMLCYNGEVSIEECDSTRQKVCEQTISNYSDFSIGNCKVNVWQDCTGQNTSEDCEDTDIRDCKWIDYRHYSFTENGLLNDEDLGADESITGACVPKYAPGFGRDQDTRVFGGTTCAIGTATCLVTYEKGLLESGWDCEDNCYCEEEEFANNINAICSSLGDCGTKKNYIEIFGKKQEDVITKERIKPED